MKFKITQQNLDKCLRNVTPFADKGQQSDLKNIKLKTNQNILETTATNYSNTFIIEKTQGSCSKQGGIVISADLFRKYIQSLPNDNSKDKPSTIELEAKDNKLQINCQNIKATINYISDQEFAEIPMSKGDSKPIFTIKASELKTALSKVILTANKDTTRAVLCGVLFHVFDNQLYLVATDGHRLAELKLPKSIVKLPKSADFKLLISANTLMGVERVLMNYSNSNISFYNSEEKKCVLIAIDDADIEIITTLIQGVYPDYRSLIPEDFKTKILVSKQALIDAAKRTRLFSQEISPSIVLSWQEGKKELSIKSSTSQIGENSEVIAATIKAEKEADQIITLNVKYLQEALQVMETDFVELNLNAKYEPCVIKEADQKQQVSDNYRHVVMPLRS